jgi:cation:H+ antiporter
MTIVSSLPEIFIGISSAIHQHPQLSLGNVMGSNIIVLTLVIGIGGLVAKGLDFESMTIRHASYYSALIAPIPLFLMIDGVISRWDGLVLIITVLFYFHHIITQEKKFTQTISDVVNGKKANNQYFYKNILLLVVSIALLLGSAEGMVWSATKLADQLNISLSFIGLLLVAIGTSAPELSFGLRSISLGQEEMLLGDAIGSVVINSGLVLGVTAIIQPITIPSVSPYLISIFYTVAIAMLFVFFARSDHKISTQESVFLLFSYALFLITEIIVAH